MYRLSKQLELMEALGLVGIRVYKVSNERPLPGEKLTGGMELTVQNDQGFLGVFNSREKLTFVLAAEVERRSDLHVVWAEGHDRNLRDLADQALPSADASIFAKRIPTDKTLSGEWVTKSTDNLGNSIWVISTADGQLQMWEVAVVSILANGQAKLYLSLQKVYAGEMFACTLEEGPDQWDDPVYVKEEEFPGFCDWTSLRVFLSQVVSTVGLRMLSEHKPSLEPKEPKLLLACQAAVVWFNQAKGFGFAEVTGEERNPIFHRTSVQDQEFPAFEPKQILAYSFLDRTPKGAQLRGVREV